MTTTPAQSKALEDREWRFFETWPSPCWRKPNGTVITLRMDGTWVAQGEPADIWEFAAIMGIAPPGMRFVPEAVAANALPALKWSEKKIETMAPQMPEWADYCNALTALIDALSQDTQKGAPSDDAYLQSPGWKRQMAEADADERAGRVRQVESGDALIRELNDGPSESEE